MQKLSADIEQQVKLAISQKTNIKPYYEYDRLIVGVSMMFIPKLELL